jgi:hypothetical protein
MRDDVVWAAIAAGPPMCNNYSIALIMPPVEAHEAQPLDDSALPQWRMLELDRLHWGGLCLSRHSILLAVYVQ